MLNEKPYEAITVLLIRLISVEALVGTTGTETPLQSSMDVTAYYTTSAGRGRKKVINILYDTGKLLRFVVSYL